MHWRTDTSLESLSKVLLKAPTHEVLLSSNNMKYAELEGTVMQIEKALINDRLSDLKVFWKFPILTI